MQRTKYLHSGTQNFVIETEFYGNLFRMTCALLFIMTGFIISIDPPYSCAVIRPDLVNVLGFVVYRHCFTHELCLPHPFSGIPTNSEKSRTQSSTDCNLFLELHRECFDTALIYKSVYC